MEWYHRAARSGRASLLTAILVLHEVHMGTMPDCPYCHSHDVRRLNAAVTGVSGYRCGACAKIFYFATPQITKQIEEARARRDPPDEQPLRRTVPRKD
jgi:transposase-like protein